MSETFHARRALDDARWRILRAAIAPAGWDGPAAHFPRHVTAALSVAARGQRISALLDEGMVRVGIARPLAAQSAQGALFASMVLQSKADQLAAALDAAGVEHAFLKGLVTDVAYYGGRGRRETSDFDVLIGAAAARRAEQALIKLGAHRFTFEGRDGTAASSHGHAWAWPRRGAAPLAIDLHHRLTDPPIVDFSTEALAARRPHRGPGGLVRVGLSPAHQVAYAAANLVADGLSGRLKQTLDAAHILRAHPGCLDEAALVAQRHGFGAGLYGLLRLVEERLGVAPDAASLATLKPPPARRAFVEAVFGVYAPPLGLRGMPTRLLLPDHVAANVTATARWAALRLVDRSPARLRRRLVASSVR